MIDGRALPGGAMSYRVLPVAAQPHAAVLFAHGFAEGALRHTRTLLAFAAAGVATYAYDMHGHGGSPGPRGLIRRFDDVLGVAALMRARIRDEWPELPLFLMGYSLGGLASVRSVQRDPERIAGVVLIGSGFEIGAGIPVVVRRLGVGIGEVAPGVPVARLRLRDLRPAEARAGGFLDRLLPRDPLVPARTAGEAMRASDAALRAIASWNVPTLVVHGDGDRVVPLAFARRFAEAATNARVTLEVVRGGHHDLLSGAGGDAIRDRVLAWIAENARR